METQGEEQAAGGARGAGRIGRERGRVCGAGGADPARRGTGEAGAAGAGGGRRARRERRSNNCTRRRRWWSNCRSELNALRAERDQVRQRVERLLAQLDALEL